MIRVAGDARPFMQLPSEHFRFISPGYFEALRLPLLAGRTLAASDEGKMAEATAEPSGASILKRRCR